MDSAANLNSHLMKEVYEQFKIEHRNSTPYRLKAKRVVEAANKNIKKILRKMIQGSRQWHEKLLFALLGYRTTVCTSTGAMPYLLVYGTEGVRIQYDMLSKYCKECKLQGHDEIECWRLHPELIENRSSEKRNDLADSNNWNAAADEQGKTKNHTAPLMILMSGKVVGALPQPL
ncbi:uncharacterized protein [Nicotiana tomentosiformis]|uniref:uncharacterized protein n=1 Tax=Nicotiana tomentosiformis TaxID=4098 RepID=UPI00388C9E71